MEGEKFANFSRILEASTLQKPFLSLSIQTKTRKSFHFCSCSLPYTVFFDLAMEKASILRMVLMLGLLGLYAEGLGVNWGTQATHKLPPETVVQMLKDNGIQKVKLFDADDTTMSALAGSGIEVMVAIPNNQLADMNDYKRAQQWVRKNVTRYNFDGGVKIK